MDDYKFMEIAKSLVCVLDKNNVKEILLGEQWLIAEIKEFINECEGK